MDEIESIAQDRKRIDQITEKLVRLIRERDKAVIRIGVKKKRLGLTVKNRKREEAVLRSARAMARKHGVDPQLVGRIMLMLIRHSRNLQ